MSDNITVIENTTTHVVEITNALNAFPVIDSLSADVLFDGTTNKVYTATEKTNLSSHLSSTSNPHNVTKTQVGLGNVDNTSDANKPVSTAQQTALNLKANIASPSLTGIPTAPTATAGTNTTQIATTAFTQSAIAGIVNSSPEALDTLKELATALGNDANFATTMTNALAGKAPLASPTFTGTVTAPTFSGALTGNASTATKLATARTIGTSGDVLATATAFDGTAAITLPATIQSNVVTNTKLADMDVNTFKGRVTAGTGDPEDLTVAQVKTALTISNVENKSSATIRGELTSANVTAALTFTPENAANKNAVNGYAGLDSGGKISASQLPAIAVTDTFVVASQVAMLALTAEVGDIAVRTDLNKSYILKTAGASVLANWQELLTPTDAVSSVNGMTGAVTVSTITGNAGTATKLATARTIATSGDAVGTATSFDGSANITIPLTLATVATAGTYDKVTVDAKGRVTAGTNHMSPIVAAMIFGGGE